MRDSAKETLEAPAIRTSSKRWRSVHTSLKRSRRSVMVTILVIILRSIGSDHLIKDFRIILCVLPGPSPETGPRCFSCADARMEMPHCACEWCHMVLWMPCEW